MNHGSLNTLINPFKSITCTILYIHVCLCATDRISGNGASEKNLKDGVCAQFEKNFAKAKWRVRRLDFIKFSDSVNLEMMYWIKKIVNDWAGPE